MKRLLLVLVVVTATWASGVCASEPIGTKECPDPYSAFGLQAFNEPLLTAVGKRLDYFAIRLTYLPTFRHPIVLRYEENGSNLTRRAAVLTGRFGFSAGDLGFQKIDNPSRAEIEGIKQALNDSGFWALPTKDDVMGADGDILMVEVVNHGECKAISRWQPDFNAQVRGLAKLVDLYTALYKRAGIWADVNK
ncbi:hypothetical protein [Dyella flagellata]|uniref:Lipoprotein n=1 Tax=Dyella flagellata TaxID=1867833 RepID=A0ABQ5X9B0_9GAMM|nr:hypothetical protein [Dyella flagellata]GLQ88255.1 hypothetical protein GCM10007898_18240 [Dyella flagellata]